MKNISLSFTAILFAVFANGQCTEGSYATAGKHFGKELKGDIK